MFDYTNTLALLRATLNDSRLIKFFTKARAHLIFALKLVAQCIVSDGSLPDAQQCWRPTIYLSKYSLLPRAANTTNAVDGQ